MSESVTSLPPACDAARSAEIPAGVTAILTIDLDAIVANWRLLQQRVGAGCRVAATVKADAYGLGIRPVALALAEAGCRQFFVATVGEAAELAEILGPGHPACRIAVIAGPIPGSAAAIAALPSLVPVINDLGQLESWEKAAPGRPAMLHVDTGMSRLGMEPAELRRLARAPERLARVPISTVLSHLACPDMPGHPMNRGQLQLFETLAGLLPGIPRSLAASFGIFLGAEYHFDLVRPGAALYGLNPRPGQPNPMREVVGIKAKILQIREIDAGRSVGYGARYTADRRHRIATLGLGYADGIMRVAGDRASLYFGPIEVPIIGRVSMDLLTVDLSALPAHVAAPGDFVDVVGPHCGADDLARDSGTIGYELLTRLGRRLHRLYRPAAR